MKQTKQLMEQIITKEYVEMADEKALSLYKENKDSCVIAKYFLKLYPTIYSVVYNFHSGTTEDKISAVLSALDKALTTYDNTKGSKLTTYIIMNVRYYVHQIYWDNYVSKGKKDVVIESLDKMKEFYDDQEYEKHIIKSFMQEYEYVSQNAEFQEFLKECDFTDIQLCICKCLIQDDKVKYKDVCQKLNITQSEFNKERNKIKKKLLFLYSM